MKLLVTLFLGLSVVLAAPPWPSFSNDHRRPTTGSEKNEPPIRLLHQYPLGTRVENIAVRENGNLLLTFFLSPPHLQELNPFDSSGPQTLHTFDSVNSLMGIAESSPEVFTLAVGNIASGDVEGGNWSIWNVDFDVEGGGVGVRKVVDIPQAVLLNGMTSLPGREGSVLVGDLMTGDVWRVDARSGEREVVIENDLTEPVGVERYGVNGVNVRDGFFYFVSSGLDIFARQPILPNGLPTSPPTIVSRLPDPAVEGYYDDFAISHDGKSAYITTGPGHSIEKVSLEDGQSQGLVEPGVVNGTRFADATSCAVGRTRWDWWVLYVVTTGGQGSEPVVKRQEGEEGEVVGGQVWALDTRRWGEMIDGGGRGGGDGKGRWWINGRFGEGLEHKWP